MNAKNTELNWNDIAMTIRAVNEFMFRHSLTHQN